MTSGPALGNSDWGSGNIVMYRSLHRHAVFYVQPRELGRHRLNLNQSQNPWATRDVMFVSGGWFIGFIGA
jgi:hypothetical protein